MKEIKKDKSSIFSEMFSNAKPLKCEDLSEWIIPTIYHLNYLNQKQLQIVHLFEIEILQDENNLYFIRLNSRDHAGIIALLNTLKDNTNDYKEKLNRIPFWVRKIFKAS